MGIPNTRVLGLAAAVAAMDLGTKALAENQLVEPEALAAGFELRVGYNSGVAFGLLDRVPTAFLVLVILACAGLGIHVLRRSGVRGAWLVLALVLGGAAANLADRVADGRVTDFVDPPGWPAFNLADVAITVGVSLFLLSSLREPQRETVVS